MAQRKEQGKSLTLKRHGLSMECFYKTGKKLERKVETLDGKRTEFEYAYDGKGRLADVWKDGEPVESYRYDKKGRRIEQAGTHAKSGSGTQEYNQKGQLTHGLGNRYEYDAKGTLTERKGGGQVLAFTYGEDTLLDEVIVNSGTEIRYERERRDQPGPSRRFRNDTLTGEYEWARPYRLGVYRDYDMSLEFRFRYDASGILDRVRIDRFTPKDGKGVMHGFKDVWASSMNNLRRERLEGFMDSLPCELLCCCDQVGTLRALLDANNKLVKRWDYDSFGVLLEETFKSLEVPLGFAGGLTDPDTGLVRLGFRDYDPLVGRFMAKDPARDRRGDGDLYDYCVDDPVNGRDPSGLTGISAQLSPEEERQLEERERLEREQVEREAEEAAAAQRAAMTRPRPSPESLAQIRPQANEPPAQSEPQPPQAVPAQASPAQTQEQPQIPAAATTTAQPTNAGGGRVPGGIRRNNPGNLRPINDTWQGQTGVAGGFSVFDTPENGLRAMAVDLSTKYMVHGLRTVTGILQQYAPIEDDNITEAYIDHVCQRLGVGPDEEFDLNGENVFSTLMNTMILHENGQNPYSEEQIETAINTALEHRRRRDTR